MKVIEFKKVSFSAMQNIKTVNILTADDKYSLLNRDKLMEPLQIPLPLKQKNFSRFLPAFLKYTLNFEDFFNKMTVIADVFLK